VILDGEIVALRAGRPDFGLLRSRVQVRRPAAGVVQEAPVRLYLFGLLYQGPDSLLDLPCTQRRARLEDLGLDADPVRTPPRFRDHADAVLAASREQGLEGVVGKPLASATARAGARPGSRSRTSGTRRSSSAAGNPARAAAPIPSGRCRWVSTITASCAMRATSAPGSPTRRCPA